MGAPIPSSGSTGGDFGGKVPRRESAVRSPGGAARTTRRGKHGDVAQCSPGGTARTARQRPSREAEPSSAVAPVRLRGRRHVRRRDAVRFGLCVEGRDGAQHAPPLSVFVADDGDGDPAAGVRSVAALEAQDGFGPVPGVERREEGGEAQPVFGMGDQPPEAVPRCRAGVRTARRGTALRRSRSRNRSLRPRCRSVPQGDAAVLRAAGSGRPCGPARPAACGRRCP